MKKLILPFIAIALIVAGAIYAFSPQKWEYVELSANDQTLSVKYVEFETPLKSHQVTGPVMHDDVSSYPQWCRFLKFSALDTEIGKTFDASMFIPLSPERTETMRQLWPEQVRAQLNAAQTLKNSDIDLNTSIQGLLFIRHENKEYVLIKTEIENGQISSMPRVINNEFKRIDTEVEKHPWFFGHKDFDYDKIVTELKSTDNGFITFSGDPLTWNLD